MITITAISFYYTIFFEDTKYMTILTRQEKERLVLDLYYNQGKTYLEISKAARISPRDIGVILNKAIEEKTEASKEEQDNINSKNYNQENEQLLNYIILYHIVLQLKLLLLLMDLTIFH